jgi:hypothetical protein
MKPSILGVALITLCLNNFVTAQEVTNPIHYTWIASSCETWNCAAAALVMANGEPNVIVLPTNVPDFPWVILRRVESGSIYIPETEAFGCDVYAEVNEATSNYNAMEGCRKAMVLTVPDGRSVVVSLHKCDSGARRRAVR